MAIMKAMKKPVHGKGGQKKVAKGHGKGAKAGGSWMFIPSGAAMPRGSARQGIPKALAKGLGKNGRKGQLLALAKGLGKGGRKGHKGAAKPQSKFMEKLGKIAASQKIWIGGLSEKTNWKSLQKHIEEVTGLKAKLTEVLPKGKACVAFKTDDDADSARSLVNDTELQGKSIQADVWTQKERKEQPEGEGKKRKGNKKGAAPEGGALKVLKGGFAKRNANAKDNKPIRGDLKMKEKLSKVDNDLKVWVGGMAKDTTFGRLRKFFAEAGHKPSIVNLTGRDRACVSFKTADEASSAISDLNGKELDGSTLEVDVWTQPTDEDLAARKEERKQKFEERKQRREEAKAEKKAAKAAAAA